MTARVQVRHRDAQGRRRGQELLCPRLLLVAFPKRVDQGAAVKIPEGSQILFHVGTHEHQHLFRRGLHFVQGHLTMFMPLDNVVTAFIPEHCGQT